MFSPENASLNPDAHSAVHLGSFDILPPRFRGRPSREGARPRDRALPPCPHRQWDASIVPGHYPEAGSFSFR